jgi:hypothetical protein
MALAVIVLAVARVAGLALATSFEFSASGTRSPRSAPDGSDIGSMGTAAQVGTPIGIAITAIGHRIPGGLSLVRASHMNSGL